MKIAFIIHNEHYTSNVMELLKDAGIDYYTRFDNVKGKGHGTDPHLGTGGFSAVNSVLMIAFRDEAPLEKLIGGIIAANAQIKRSDDHMRLFQLALERFV